MREEDDYHKLKEEEGFESTIDPCRLGLIVDVLLDPNALSSSNVPLHGSHLVVSPEAPSAGLPPYSFFFLKIAPSNLPKGSISSGGIPRWF